MRSLDGFKIEMDKRTLIALLQENREKHIEEFKAAEQRYQLACIDALKKRLERLKLVMSGDSKMNPSKFLRFHSSMTNRALDSAYPKNNADVYDEVLEMLQHHKPKVITLNSRQYQHWVKDDWDWKGGFIQDTASY